MRYPKMFLVRSLLAAVLLTGSLAHADVITDWNAIAFDTVTGSGRYRAYEESHIMTMVNTAMSETINFNEAKGPSRLLVTPSKPIGTSSEAATAGAAYYILVQFHPEQKAKLDLALKRSLDEVHDEVKRESGLIMGMALGMNIYAILSSARDNAAAKP